MAYKKYIKRGGKVYGPYLYHSRRVDGKVVSEYHGSKKLNYGKFLAIFLGVFFLVTVVYFLGFQKVLTGHVALDLDVDYAKGQPLEGKVKLILDEGEKVSDSSKLVFENNGESFEYNLSDFTGVMDEEVFPLVYFKLSVLLQGEDEENETVEFETEIEGQVSATENFTYFLKDGERAELKPRSAKTRLKQLSDSALEIKTEGNEVVVTTDYSEVEEGSREIIIELSELGLVFEKGNLDVVLVDGGEIIASTTIVLGEDPVEEIEESVTEPPLTNEEIDEDDSEDFEEENVNETLIPPEILELTTEERLALVEEFGSTSVEITEAISKNGFVTIRYEIGTFWVENSYSDVLSNETLERFMEEDRIKWLKDVVKSLLKEPSLEENLEEFLGEH